MRTRALAAGIVLLLFVRGGHAYSLLGYSWPFGTSIVMQLEQGSSGGTLKDGSPDWNTVTDGALTTWNQIFNSNNISFRSVRNSTAPVGLRNGLNNVFWSSTVYGQPFGDAVAITVSLFAGATTVETDVLFNNNLSWNSYHGNLIPASNGDTLYDLRRVALHEFGHVIGLDHPDQHGQSVVSIMNSRASDIDRLRIDDANGARSVYRLLPLSFNSLRSSDASFNLLFPGEALVTSSSIRPMGRRSGTDEWHRVIADRRMPAGNTSIAGSC